MHKFFASIFSLFLSPLGLVVLAGLDSTVFFFLPLAVESAVVFLTARNRDLVWVFPILAAAGSVCGAAVTFSLGAKIGGEGLKHWFAEQKLKSVETRIKKKGAFALGSVGLLPPPFPLAGFILECGALKVKKVPFLAAFGVARVLRFSVIALLAVLYGRWILRFMESTAFRRFVIVFAFVAIAGTAYSIYHLRRRRSS